MSNTQNNDRSTSSSAMAMEEEDEQQVPRSSTTSNKGKHGNMINIIDDGYTADVSSISDGDSTLMNKDQQQQGDSKLGLVIDILQPARKKPRNDDLQSFCRNNSSSLYRSPFPTYRVSRNSNSRHRSRGRHHRRHRRRRPSSKIHEGRFQQQRPAPSPIHPDIDISLTHHIMTGDLLCPTTDVAIQDAVMPLSNSNSSNGPTPAEAASTTGGDTTSTSVGPVVPALTEAVLQYFRDWKRDTTVNSGLRDTGSEQPQQQQQQVLQQQQQQLETARVSSDTVETMVPETKGHRNTTTTNNNNGNRKRRHRLDDGSSPPSSPPVAGASKNDNANVKHQMQEAAQAQVISDVASFSNRHYKLEDALELTDTPRYVHHPKMTRNEETWTTRWPVTNGWQASSLTNNSSIVFFFTVLFSFLSDYCWNQTALIVSFTSMLPSREISLSLPVVAGDDGDDEETHRNAFRIGWNVKTICSPRRIVPCKKPLKISFPIMFPSLSRAIRL